ncbi:MAG: gas vesicle protein GvpJ, partial [Candidatus Aerophobetes bacterium]|nr:gas vesicle protein GvpJ [Candidatus Aerophobetes bacterium]
TLKREEGIGVNIDPEATKADLMSLLVTLCEILKDVLKRQAQRMIKKGGLTEEKKDRLEEAFFNADRVIEELKTEQDIVESCRLTEERLNQEIYGDDFGRHKHKLEPLTDTLDVLLTKGTVIYGDIILGLADVALAGINLKAALAGGVTMLEHNIMDDREVLLQKKKEYRVPLRDDDGTIISIFGSYYLNKPSVQPRWQLGRFYITDKRLFFFKPYQERVSFEVSLEKIHGWCITDNNGREELYLLLETDNIARLHSQDIKGLKGAIEEKMKAQNLPFEEETSLLSPKEEGISISLTDGEYIINSGQMWYFTTSAATAIGAKGATWKPGQLYLTNKRLCWWDNLLKRIFFEIPKDEIAQVSIGTVNLEKRRPTGKAKKIDTGAMAPNWARNSNTGINAKALVISTTDGKEAYFSGKNSDMQKWRESIEKIIG